MTTLIDKNSLAAGPASILFVKLFVALGGMAPGAVRFPATPELHGYPLRCMERKKRKEETRGKRKGKEMCAVVVPLWCASCTRR